MNDGFRVAIVHYHLRRGGVTRVIESACQALEQHGVPAVVLSGEPPEAEFAGGSCRVCAIPGLGYDAGAACDTANTHNLRTVLTETAASVLGAPPDIWHFHNPALGKNPAVTRLADSLARDGTAVISQIHDFAEDQRPENWRTLVESVGGGKADGLETCLYPVAAHARIAVLNERDRGILLLAGAPPDKVVLLPNPVTVPPDMDGDGAVPQVPARRWVYPTRAIRRKNLGEFLLWAAVADRGDRFASTLAPTHPRDRQVYETWRRLAAELRLPVDFGVGLKGEQEFRQTMREATAMVTTSVAEGFGLAFLEPWLMGKAVVGRRLPEITEDMKKNGVDLSVLYDRLDVPVEWIGMDALRTSLGQGLNRAYRAYAMQPPQDVVARALAGIVRDRSVDFGGLDESMQRAVVRRVAGSPESARALRPTALATADIDLDLIERNRHLVRENYAIEAYGKRLRELYAGLLQHTNELEHVSAAAVLRQFLQPERFRLLRMEH